MPGRSWPREIRPTPMAPTLMRLLGDSCPKTLEGTMVGKPTAAAAPREVFRNVLRDDTADCFLSGITSLSSVANYFVKVTSFAFFCALITSSAAIRHWV